MSRSAQYALMAAGYVAQHTGNGAVLARNIAEHYQIPLGYLLKILQQLVRGSILHSVRGPQGGFTLAKPPEQITILNIIEAIEGPFSEKAPFDNINDQTYRRKLADLYHRSTTQAAHILDSASLADMVNGR